MNGHVDGQLPFDMASLQHPDGTALSPNKSVRRATSRPGETRPYCTISGRSVVNVTDHRTATGAFQLLIRLASSLQYIGLFSA